MKKIVFLFLILIIPINVNAISAKSYIVMDADNNRIFEAHNIHNKALIASVTKIMTAMVVINNTKLDEVITIEDNVLKSYGSGIYVEVGEKLTIKELLYGLMLRSGNDAAIALAHYVGGSMQGFAKLMNETAASLGMKNTNFINSHGLEESNKEGNISTSYDIALLSSYAIKNKVYKEITGTKQITVKTNYKTYIWNNKNRLLKSYPYCIGGKTGFTELSRKTLVTNAYKNGVNLTVVTLNDGNDFNDHHFLYEKHFKNLKNYIIISSGKIKTNIANTYINNSFNMSLTRKEYQDLKMVINYYENNVTNIIGDIEVNLYGKNYYRGDIYVKTEVKNKKQNFFKKIIKKMSNIW